MDDPYPYSAVCKQSWMLRISDPIQEKSQGDSGSVCKPRNVCSVFFKHPHRNLYVFFLYGNVQTYTQVEGIVL